MAALNKDAKAVLRAAGITPAMWARANYSTDGIWSGDACGCPDDRCKDGFHHHPGQECGCLRTLLDSYVSGEGQFDGEPGYVIRDPLRAETVAMAGLPDLRVAATAEYRELRPRRNHHPSPPPFDPGAPRVLLCSSHGVARWLLERLLMEEWAPAWSEYRAAFEGARIEVTGTLKPGWWQLRYGERVVTDGYLGPVIGGIGLPALPRARMVGGGLEQFGSSVGS